MIYIKIELWPRGDRTKAKRLGEAFIANDASGDVKKGNYKAVFLGKRKGVSLRRSEVTGFPRLRLGVYDLLYRALKAAYGDRNEPKAKTTKPKVIEGV